MMLNLLAEKVMHEAIQLEHVAYCPTMDLVAIATADNQVHIFRLNGQRVFGVANKLGLDIKQLKWKPNGQRLSHIF